MGQAEGFACETQGTLFFDIAQILRVKRPPAILLENVKNLKSHDSGRTYKIIIDTLERDLGYTIFDKIVDARHFVPQHRERIFLVGFREKVDFSWDKVRIPFNENPTLQKILHPGNGSEKPEKDYTKGSAASVNPKYTLSRKLWRYLQNYADKHKEKGNGFGFGLIDPNHPDSKGAVTRTLSARYFKDGSEILIDTGGDQPRRLTPKECRRLMGFPDEFEIPVSDTQAYRQFGNSVVVPVVTEIARAMTKHLA